MQANENLGVLAIFHHWDKIPEIIKLKGRKIYFGSWFQPLCSDILAQYNMRNLWWRRPVHLITARKQKRDR
jgi:hypothetical protein